MNKAEKAAWKRIEHYRKLMSLQGWGFRITFARDDEGYGKASVSHQYREADLAFDLDRHDDSADRGIDLTIRHELAHVVLGPLSAFAMTLCKDDKTLMALLDDVEDGVATHISHMLVWGEKG